jgi:hypothetical protein
MDEFQRRLKPETFLEVKRVMRGLVGHRYRVRLCDVVAPDELHLAQKLLAEGRTRAEAKGILMERLQISKRKAYRLLSRALDSRAAALPAQPVAVREVAMAMDEED